jgi:hypothetical protein
MELHRSTQEQTLIVCAILSTNNPNLSYRRRVPLASPVLCWRWCIVEQFESANRCWAAKLERANRVRGNWNKASQKLDYLRASSLDVSSTRPPFLINLRSCEIRRALAKPVAHSNRASRPPTRRTATHNRRVPQDRLAPAPAKQVGNAYLSLLIYVPNRSRPD